MFNNRIRKLSQEEQFLETITSIPYAMSEISGSQEYSSIKGTVYFFKHEGNIIVSAFVSNLPAQNNVCANNIFAFHIHEGEDCGGDNFEDSLNHFNPNKCPHPAHAGDMLPLFANKNGRAILIFQTDRFNLEEIIGKTVIIHSSVDDFTSQPSGNSGTKIACGIIVKK